MDLWKECDVLEEHQKSGQPLHGTAKTDLHYFSLKDYQRHGSIYFPPVHRYSKPENRPQ